MSKNIQSIMLISNCCNSSVKEDQGLQIDSTIQLGICLECFEHCLCIQESDENN